MAGSANPNMVQPITNPYNQASMAQMGAMDRTAQGLNQTAAQGMGAYANPYEQSVVNKTLRDVGGAAQIGLNTLDAQATAANALFSDANLIVLSNKNNPILQVDYQMISAFLDEPFSRIQRKRLYLLSHYK